LPSEAVTSEGSNAAKDSSNTIPPFSDGEIDLLISVFIFH